MLRFAAALLLATLACTAAAAPASDDGYGAARELVADDVAAACSSRTAYATDLLELAQLRSGFRRPALPAAALGIFRSPSHFYRRLHMLVHRDTRLESRCPSAWKLASGK